MERANLLETVFKSERPLKHSVPGKTTVSYFTRSSLDVAHYFKFLKYVKSNNEEGVGKI